MPPRLAPTQVTGMVAAAAVEPRGHQIRQAAHRDRIHRVGVVEPLPRRSVAGPRRAEHRMFGGIDQVRRAERGPPRGARVLAFRLPVAERERRRGDAADDQDHGGGAELGPVDPAAERHVFELAAFDGQRQVFDHQPPRAQVGGRQGCHRGIVPQNPILYKRIYIDGYDLSGRVQFCAEATSRGPRRAPPAIPRRTRGSGCR